MTDDQFEKAMDVIRSHTDRVYLLEGDRKPVLLLHAKEQNENVEKLVLDINKHCENRLDVLLLQEFDQIKIGESSDVDEEVGDEPLLEL